MFYPFVSHSHFLGSICRCQSAPTAHKPLILTTTAIIEVLEGGEFKGVVLIERGKAPFGRAIPGGKVEYGEMVENAVRREMIEEVNLQLDDLRILCRRHPSCRFSTFGKIAGACSK